jgi:hypothetical protein
MWVEMIATVEDAKRALGERGFRPMFLDSMGDMPPMALFTYAWDLPFMETIVVRAEEDATSYRSRREGFADPFSPRNIVWHHTGTFVEAVAELFDLPRPGERGAPERIVAAPSVLWTPGHEKRGTIEPLKTLFGI